MEAPVGANPTPDSIDVTWKAIGNATGYRLFRNKGDGAGREDYSVCVHNGPNDGRTTFVVTDLLPATGYRFKVSAVNAAGEGPKSGSSEVVETLAEIKAVKPPGKPAAPRLNVKLPATHDQIPLDWEPPADTGGGTITGYKVYRTQHGDLTSAPSLVCYHDKDDARTDAVISGLKGGTKYRFSVVACNTAGEGPASDPSTFLETEPEEASQTVPDAPEAPVTGETTGNSVQVKWLAPTNTGGGDITGYKVMHDGASDGKDFSAVGYDGTGNTATECVVRGLKSQSEYRFKVQALNSAGASPWSAPSAPGKTTADTTNDPPQAPRRVKAANPTERTVNLDWQAPAAGPPPTGYRVYRSDGALALDAAGKPETEAVIKGLQPGTTYTFKVAAQNEFGEGPLSEPSEPVRTANALPGAPAGEHLQVDWEKSGHDFCGLRWKAPEDTGGDAPSGYVVYRTDPPGNSECNVPCLKTKGPATDGVVKELMPDTEYRFKVAAVNSVGEGPASPAVTFTTGKSCPAAPQAVAVKAATVDKITVEVTKPRHDGGYPPILHYKVYRTDTDQDKFIADVPYTGDKQTVEVPSRGLVTIVSVSAVNSHSEGPRTSSGEARHNGVPAAPGKPSKAALVGEGGTVTVPRPPYDGGNALTNIIVYAEKDGKEVGRVTAVDPLAAAYEVPVKGLAEPGPEAFRASATNAMGESAKSEASDPFPIAADAAKAKAEEEARAAAKARGIKEHQEAVARQKAEEERKRKAREAEEAKFQARRDELQAAAKAKLLAAKPVINAVIEDETGFERVEIVSCKPGGAFKDAEVLDGCCCTHVNDIPIAGNARFKAEVGKLTVGEVYPFTFIHDRKKPEELVVKSVMINGTGFADMSELRTALRHRDGKWIGADDVGVASDAERDRRREELVKEAEEALKAAPTVNVVIENEGGVGVEIVTVKEDGAFDDANVPEGCVCTHVGDDAVMGNDSFKAIIAKHKPGDQKRFKFKDPKTGQTFEKDVVINAKGILTMVQLRNYLRLRDRKFNDLDGL
jgi:hypothetical protein